MLGKLLRHISNYSLGNLLITASGFISFPILTRVFSLEEYGILNLIAATLTLLLGLAKLGTQHSMVRFYAEIKSGKRSDGLNRYYATTLFGMLAVGIGFALLWASVSQLAPAEWWSDPRIKGLFLLSSLLLVIRIADSCMINILRAEERSGTLSIYEVVKRYGALGAVLLTLFYLSGNLYGYYWATIAAEAFMVASLFLWLRRTRSFSPGDFSPDLYRSLLAYGIPMVGFELSGATLQMGDRYVIEAMIGSAPLGIYSAAYNFCGYVQVVALASIGRAVVPMYIRCWEENGPEETVKFVRKTLHFYLMIALPVVAGLSAVGGDMLAMLASEKYRQGETLILYVIGGMAIDAMIAFSGAGLYIFKRSTTMAAWMIFSAVLNIALNIALIPSMGIEGSALATLLSYGVLAIGIQRVSNRLLPLDFPWLATLKFATFSVAVYWIVVAVETSSLWLTLVARIAVGVLVYSTLVICFDSPARAIAANLFAKLRRHNRPD